MTLHCHCPSAPPQSLKIRSTSSVHSPYCLNPKLVIPFRRFHRNDELTAFPHSLTYYCQGVRQTLRRSLLLQACNGSLDPLISLKSRICLLISLISLIPLIFSDRSYFPRCLISFFKLLHLLVYHKIGHPDTFFTRICPATTLTRSADCTNAYTASTGSAV